MPTPESARFLKKKPTVPPTFDGVDFDDARAVKAAGDAIIRAQWVDLMKARLVGDELTKCYRREGVNHLEKCAYWRELYLETIPDRKIRGFQFEMRNIMPKPSS